MPFKTFIYRLINTAFNPHFRDEVRKLKRMMLHQIDQIAETDEVSIVIEAEICSYYQGLHRKYSSTIVAAIREQATKEVEKSINFEEDELCLNALPRSNRAYD